MAKTEKTNFNLLLMLALDLKRQVVMILLYLAVVTSALAVVISTHKNRELLITHEELIQEKDDLDIEWRHLIIEQNALAEHNRIERIVQQRLNMYRPENAEIVLLRED